MNLLSNILLLLVGSRLLGELLHRLKQPRIVGELLAGVLLGPLLLGWVHPTERLEGISELSIFLVVVVAGLEMEFREVVRSLKGRGIVASLMAFFVPLVGGLLVGLVFGLGTTPTVFLALCISVTALPVTIRVLDGFGLLQSQIARYAVSAAILNDIVALLLLGAFLDLPSERGQGSIWILFQSLGLSAGKLVLFVVVVYSVNRLLKLGSGSTRFIDRGIGKLVELFGNEALFGLAIFFILVFGSIAEGLGSHFIIGAFFGGLLLSNEILGESRFEQLNQTFAAVTNGFLAPIFFAYLGLLFGVEGFERPFLLVSVLVVAMLTKILAGQWGGRFLGLSEAESLGMGVILNGRGIMELVVANIAYSKGLIGRDLFSILVMMGIVTTIMTPLLFRKWVAPKLPKAGPA